MGRKPADQSVNREEILWAAAEVMRHQGYDAATMKDIAGQINLTAASLYHHFKNKDFLLLSVLEYGLELGTEMLESIASSDLSYAEKLDAMIRTHIMGITQNVAVGAAMVFEMRSLRNVNLSSRRIGRAKTQVEYIERRDRFFERRDYFEQLFRDMLTAGIEAGEFRPVDVAVVTRTILGAQNWLGVWFREGGRLTGDEVADVMVDFFMSGLRSEENSESPTSSPTSSNEE